MKVGELTGREVVRRIALNVPQVQGRDMRVFPEGNEVKGLKKEDLGIGEKEKKEREDLQVKNQDVDRLVDLINEAMEILNYKLKFTVHKETNQVVVKVLDKETDEVIREIPPEQILNLVAKFRDAMGIFIDTIV